MADLLIPIAISSQLDITGEERVHAAKYNTTERAVFVPPPTPSPYLAVLTNEYIGVEGRPDTDYLSVYKNDGSGFALFPMPGPPGQNGDAVAWSNNTTYLAHANGGGVNFYKRNPTEMTFLSGQPDINPGTVMRSCLFRPDDAHVAFGRQNRLYVYSRSGDTFTQILNMSGMSNDGLGALVALTYNPAGTRLVTGAGGLARVLDISGSSYTVNATAEAALATMKGAGTTVQTILYSPNGLYLAATNRNSLKLYQVSGATFVDISPSLSYDSFALKWSPDSSTIAFTNYASQVIIYDVGTASVTHTLTPSVSQPGAIAYSSDGSRLYVTCSPPFDTGAGIVVYNTTTWAEIPGEFISTNFMGYTYMHGLEYMEGV